MVLKKARKTSLYDDFALKNIFKISRIEHLISSMDCIFTGCLENILDES